MAELEKVIKSFEECLKTPRCQDCPWESCERADCARAEMPYDLVYAALEMLKAQEPKPPRFAVAYDKIFYACDNCGKSLVVMANSEGLVLQKYLPKYCSECGRAVKWDG